MGVENAETIQIIANSIGVFIAVLAGICFWVGVMNPDKVEPLTFKAPRVDDQDLFAIATGDEDYLEAHCVLNSKTEAVSTTRLQLEKDELKVLKREVEIAKLRKQLVELKARQVHAPNSKNKPKDQVDVNPIVKDCIDALVSLGEKKSVARATTNKYFASNPNTSSIEEFLSGVFK